MKTTLTVTHFMPLKTSAQKFETVFDSVLKSFHELAKDSHNKLCNFTLNKLKPVKPVSKSHFTVPLVLNKSP